MAKYMIQETPGKKVVFPDPEADEEQTPLRSLDEAKIEVARLRGEARSAGRRVDFVVVPIANDGTPKAGGANGAGATSIRLTEENRRRLAQFVGMRMMLTGDSVSMGDAVAMLVDHYEATKAFTGPDADDAILAAARTIRAARKEAAA